MRKPTVELDKVRIPVVHYRTSDGTTTDPNLALKDDIGRPIVESVGPDFTLQEPADTPVFDYSDPSSMQLASQELQAMNAKGEVSPLSMEDKISLHEKVEIQANRILQAKQEAESGTADS